MDGARSPTWAPTLRPNGLICVGPGAWPAARGDHGSIRWQQRSCGSSWANAGKNWSTDQELARVNGTAPTALRGSGLPLMRACAPSLPSDLHLRGPSDRAEGKALDEAVRCPGVVAGAVRPHHGHPELPPNQAATRDRHL